jgi:hypothetical protein
VAASEGAGALQHPRRKAFLIMLGMPFLTCLILALLLLISGAASSALFLFFLVIALPAFMGLFPAHFLAMVVPAGATPIPLNMFDGGSALLVSVIQWTIVAWLFSRRVKTRASADLICAACLVMVAVALLTGVLVYATGLHFNAPRMHT